MTCADDERELRRVLTDCGSQFQVMVLEVAGKRTIILSGPQAHWDVVRADLQLMLMGVAWRLRGNYDIRFTAV